MWTVFWEKSLVLHIPHFSIRVCSLLSFTLLCTQGGCPVGLVPPGLLWSLASICFQPVGGNSRGWVGGARVGIDSPSAPSCGLALAASSALAEQPLSASCSSRQARLQLPSFTPSGLVVVLPPAPSLWVLRHLDFLYPHPDLEVFCSLRALQLPL